MLRDYNTGNEHTAQSHGKMPLQQAQQQRCRAGKGEGYNTSDTHRLNFHGCGKQNIEKRQNEHRKCPRKLG